MLRGAAGCRDGQLDVEALDRVGTDVVEVEVVQRERKRFVRVVRAAARRIGLQSAACVVIDCQTGGILALVSMPCFDPNTFANGIGRIE